MAVTSNPFYSVIVPTYNRAHGVLPILKSVQDQTFSDFECLVIDDGSDDGEELATVVSSLSDDRFTYIRKGNGGASSARNVGFDVARGQYVALLDSDDMFLPQKLEKCAVEIAAHSGELFIYSRMIVNRGVEKVWFRPPRGILPNERMDEYLMCTAGCTQTSTMVLPVSLAQKVRFNESLPSSQDTDFAIRVANTGVEVAFIEEPLIVFDDTTHHGRVSKGNNYKAQLIWIQSMKGGQISDRAYWAYRGWQCARLASYTNRWFGLSLFLKSATRGVYPFRQACVIAAQILVPRNKYQLIADRVVSLLGNRNPREKAE